MRIPKGILKVANLCPEDGGGCAMNAVNLYRLAKEGRCRAEVTDGRSAIRCDFDEPESEILPGFGVVEEVVDGFAVMVNRDDALSADGAIGKDRYLIIDELATDGLLKMIAPEDTQVMFEGRPVEGKFPPIGDVLKEYTPVCTTAEAVGKAKTPAVRFGITISLLIQTLKTMQAASQCDQVIIEAPLIPGRPLRIQPLSPERAVEMTVLLMPAALNDRMADPLPYGAAVDLSTAAHVPQPVQMPLSDSEEEAPDGTPQTLPPTTQPGTRPETEPVGVPKEVLPQDTAASAVADEDSRRPDVVAGDGKAGTSNNPAATAAPVINVDVNEEGGHFHISNSIVFKAAPRVDGTWCYGYALKYAGKRNVSRLWTGAYPDQNAADTAGLDALDAEILNTPAKTTKEIALVMDAKKEIAHLRNQLAKRLDRPAPAIVPRERPERTVVMDPVEPAAVSE